MLSEIVVKWGKKWKKNLSRSFLCVDVGQIFLYVHRFTKELQLGYEDLLDILLDNLICLLVRTPGIMELFYFLLRNLVLGSSLSVDFCLINFEK